ncbi:MAG: tetratricopeptide repeat protein [Anaerolineales bacterium]|nr:tetratricopeptide repeat protein [Anaerolineales bacterium]
MLAAYDPHRERILTTLAWLYRAIDMPSAAFEYEDLANRLADLEHDEATLAVLVQLTFDGADERIVLAKMLRFVEGANHMLHPRRLIPWCERAVELAVKLRAVRSLAHAFHELGANHSDLGDQQQALQCYAQALALIRQVNDKYAEAATRNGIGLVYSALGDKQQALEYFEQALTLSQQVGDKRGVAAILNNIGEAYSDLGDQQNALNRYNLALACNTADWQQTRGSHPPQQHWLWSMLPWATISRLASISSGV